MSASAPRPTMFRYFGPPLGRAMPRPPGWWSWTNGGCSMAMYAPSTWRIQL
jgi:hypothetical protein